MSDIPHHSAFLRRTPKPAVACSEFPSHQRGRVGATGPPMKSKKTLISIITRCGRSAPNDRAQQS